MVKQLHIVVAVFGTLLFLLAQLDAQDAQGGKAGGAGPKPDAAVPDQGAPTEGEEPKKGDAGAGASGAGQGEEGKPDKPDIKKGVKTPVKCDKKKNEIATTCPQNVEPNCVPVDPKRALVAPYPTIKNCTLTPKLVPVCRCQTGRVRDDSTGSCVWQYQCKTKGGAKGGAGAGASAPKKGGGGKKAPIGNEPADKPVGGEQPAAGADNQPADNKEPKPEPAADGNPAKPPASDQQPTAEEQQPAGKE